MIPLPWIESHTVTKRLPKLRELARKLRLRPCYLLGHLHSLWHDALELREDGDLSSWSDEMIAESAGFQGDAALWVRLLTEHRWLEEGRLIHDWLDYVGRYLIGKYSSSNRQKLIEIWAKHGRVYGSSERLASKGRVVSDKEVTTHLPTHLNQPLPTLTHPPNGGKDCPKFELTPEGMAVAFVFYSTGTRNGCKTAKEVDAGPVIADLVSIGYTPEQINAEILRKDRARSESLGEFAFRMKRAKDGKAKLTTEQENELILGPKHLRKP